MVDYLHNKPYYEFRLSGLSDDTVNVLSFEGEEEISNLFEYKIDLVSDDPELDSSKILNNAATFIINRGDEDPINIHGIISHIEQFGRTSDYVFYRAILVPQIWRLNLVFQNEIYQHTDIEKVIEMMMEDIGLTGQDFKIELKNKYPKKEYIVQYRETNLNFLQRRLEHFGIYYYFDHKGDKDVVVFTDSNSKLSSIPIDDSIGYNINKDPLSEKESISEITCKEKVVTGMVQLKDYNYMFPEKQLMAQSQIDGKYPGLYYDYGDDFENENDGELLAKVRNQEFLCGSKIFFGKSDCRYFSAGYKFKLEKHYRESWNGEYIITKVVHKGNQQGLFGLLPQTSKVLATYENNFTAIPSDIEYRPSRKTLIPKISGIMSAKIDSGSGDEYAFIDDHGRYRAKMLFDISDKSDGEATPPLRLSQGYSGAGYGMHFPNHAGTELLWACVDGNVDRPIGLGTVPNPSNASPSTGGNKAQSVIRTAGQNELTLDDTTGNENIYLHGTKNWTIKITNDKNQSLGNDESLTVEHNRTKTVNNDEKNTIKKNRTTEVLEGDEKLTVGTGNRITEIKTDDTLTVKDGNRTVNINSKDYKLNVLTGNRTIKINTNDSLDVLTGKKTDTIKGPYEITVNSGLFKIVCGSSQLILNHSGLIEIKGMDINIQGTKDVKVKGMNIESSADVSNNIKGSMVLSEAKAMNVVKGGMVQLNP